MSDVHHTAIVEDGAVLGEGVAIGPYSIVGSQVSLADGVQIHSHVTITGQTSVGSNGVVYPFSSIGHQPQDLKYAGEDSELLIGNNVIIREHVTMNPGTADGGLVTRIGNDCVFMAGTHVAHDCVIGDHVIFTNNATVGGHVAIGDYVILGGLAAVHQFARIGRHAMVGGLTGVVDDIIPFGLVSGNHAVLSGLNIVGLKRRGFSRETIHTMRSAYRMLFADEGTLQERVADVAETYASVPEVMEIIDFIRAESSRSICTPKMNRGEST